MFVIYVCIYTYLCINTNGTTSWDWAGRVCFSCELLPGYNIYTYMCIYRWEFSHLQHIFVYVYISICVCVYIQIYKHLCAKVCVDLYIHMYMYIHIHLCMYIYLYVCVCIYTYMWVCVYTDLYVYTDLHTPLRKGVCRSVYTYRSVYTHTHI